MPSDIERKQFMDEVIKPFFDNDLPKLRKHIQHLYNEISRLKKYHEPKDDKPSKKK
jgi:hypothetical protein